MNNKSLLYIAFKDFSNLHFGANSKVLSQCRSFEKYGYSVDLVGRCGSDSVLIDTSGSKSTLCKSKFFLSNSRFRNLAAKNTQYKALKRFIDDKVYDACYIRYDFSDRGFIHLLKALKKHTRKIILELPTYPYEGENKNGILNKIKLSIDKHYSKYLSEYIDYIVTFYDGHSEIFGIPVIVIPNGFDFSSMNLVNSDLPNNEIHIVAVSSMREWHGYERMIEGINDYYNQSNKSENFILHLVGNGRDYKKYKSLVEQYHLERHVIMEGPLHGELLDELYELCAIGVDSLARHRSGITVLSSLKSREYGAKGLPIINSCKIDIIEDDFPYLLRVPGDETPIDMSEVAAFYHRCYDGLSRDFVCKTIREYIESKSGMFNTLKRVIDVIEHAE